MPSEKANLRNNCLQIRKAIAPKERDEKSAVIAKKLEGTKEFKKAKHVLFYYAYEFEVNTIPLIEKWSGKKQIYLPKLINENEFEALPFDGLGNTKKGRYGIREPIEKGPHKKYGGEIDLIIVPGVAFDANCNRLGMGKGFYDRYLARFKKVPKIALAFEEQMLDNVPKDTYDKPVDLVITDKNIYLRNA